jgi:acyl dehydratase
MCHPAAHTLGLYPQTEWNDTTTTTTEHVASRPAQAGQRADRHRNDPRTGVAMTTHVTSPQALLDLAGKPLGTSRWVEVTQDQVNLFADATGDHQWIHVDPARAASGPFGTTIAHGYLTLSLAPVFLAELLQVDNVTMAINYGLEKVRFPAPVPVGSRRRAVGELVSARARGKGETIEAVIRLTYEVEGSERPACVADLLVHYR